MQDEGHAQAVAGLSVVLAETLLVHERRPGLGLVGTAQAHLVGAPTPPDRLIPRLPPPASAPDEQSGAWGLARAAGWAYVAAHPFQAAGEVLTDAVADALWYVPDKVIDHLAVDRRADWSTTAARLILLTLAVRQLEGYSGDFVVAATCDASPEEARHLWRVARYEETRLARGGRSLPAPRPEYIRDFVVLSAALQDMYEKAGSPPVRTMALRAGNYGVLPRSTAHRIKTKQSVPHSLEQFQGYLRACEVPEEDWPVWEAAWTRAWRHEKQDDFAALGISGSPDTSLWLPRRIRQRTWSPHQMRSRADSRRFTR